MLYKRSLLFVLSVILSVVLVACGGGAGDGDTDDTEDTVETVESGDTDDTGDTEDTGDTNDAGDTADTEEEETEEAEPTATADIREAVDSGIGLSFRDDAGVTVSLTYPQGWVGNGQGGSVRMATSQAVLESTTDTLNSGEITVTGLIVSSERANALAGDGTPTPAIIAGVYAETLSVGTDSFGEVEEITIGDRAAAITSGQAEGNDAILLSIEIGDGTYMVLIGGTAVGEGASLRPILEEIAVSVEYGS